MKAIQILTGEQTALWSLRRHRWEENPVLRQKHKSHSVTLKDKWRLLVGWKRYPNEYRWSPGIKEILTEDSVTYNLIKNSIHCLFINKCKLCARFRTNVF